MIKTGWMLAAVLALAAGPVFAAAPSPGLDAAFSRIAATAPGCAVGVEAQGQAPILRAYGLADLEHGVPNTPDTVFEAGSVSKQFTAASVLALAQDGRLFLSDDVRKYVPELPDYGRPITVAELLGHTSGLRDWGDVEAIGGWPRTDRVYSLEDVLRIASRQRDLNYTPGAAWSYTNTGYNLLAIIVQRVSGRSLAAFSRDRLFGPLGMTHTGWRDDFRRVVPGRAIAYARSGPGGAYEQLMPFENVYGNGGLLTTVGDLLIWNRALSDGRLGGFISAELERRTLLADGHPTDYARGLFLETHHGFREVSHSGATAGYRAWLARFPDQKVSVAILCNAADGLTPSLPYAVADLYLPPALAVPPAGAPAPVSLAGWYASTRDGAALHLVVHGGRLETSTGLSARLGADGAFTLARADGSIASKGTVLSEDRIGLDATGDTIVFERKAAYAPTSQDLQRIAGRYANSEAETIYRVSVAPDGLTVVVEERPDQIETFKPTYVGAFAAPQMTLRPVVEPDGKVAAIRVSDDRVWDLRFDRLP